MRHICKGCTVTVGDCRVSHYGDPVVVTGDDVTLPGRPGYDSPPIAVLVRHGHGVGVIVGVEGHAVGLPDTRDIADAFQLDHDALTSGVCDADTALSIWAWMRDRMVALRRSGRLVADRRGRWRALSPEERPKPYSGDESGWKNIN